MGIFIMKEIQLSKNGKNKGKYVALVDDEDFEILNKFNWYVIKHRNTFYATRQIRNNKNQTTIRIHWDIMGDKFIDHIDRNGLNNQKSNLRICTNQQNQMNRKPNKNCTSKYKGVYINKLKTMWIAVISLNNKHKYLGSFKLEIDAAKAYDNKAEELFGEFANLNFK